MCIRDRAVDALMRAIGDYAFEENINSFSFQKLPEKGIRMTLADLPDFLRKAGKEIDVDPEAELMEERPYTCLLYTSRQRWILQAEQRNRLL